MPSLVARALEDQDAFASSRGGWLGGWQRLRFFHWVNPVETSGLWRDMKLADLKALYLQALLADLPSHGWHLGLAASRETPGTEAFQGDSWDLRRAILERFKVQSVPERRNCW